MPRKLQFFIRLFVRLVHLWRGWHFIENYHTLVSKSGRKATASAGHIPATSADFKSATSAGSNFGQRCVQLPDCVWDGLLRRWEPDVHQHGSSVLHQWLECLHPQRVGLLPVRGIDFGHAESPANASDAQHHNLDAQQRFAGSLCCAIEQCLHLLCAVHADHKRRAVHPDQVRTHKHTVAYKHLLRHDILHDIVF